MQSVQSGAKQLARMAEVKGATFSTADYLFGQDLNASRAMMLQNAKHLRAKAVADALPGWDAARLEKYDLVVQAFSAAEAEQSVGKEASGHSRIGRDELIHLLNSARLVIQHAIDSTFTHRDPAHAPVRRTFELPAHRPMPE